MKKLILALTVGMLVSTSAFAWGPREQGIVTGVAGLWIFQQLQRAGQAQPPVVVYQQPPVVYQPPVINQAPMTPPVIVQPQQFCEWAPVTDQFGNSRAVQYCYYR